MGFIHYINEEPHGGVVLSIGLIGVSALFRPTAGVVRHHCCGRTLALLREFVRPEQYVDLRLPDRCWLKRIRPLHKSLLLRPNIRQCEHRSQSTWVGFLLPDCQGWFPDSGEVSFLRAPLCCALPEYQANYNMTRRRQFVKYVSVGATLNG